MTFDSATAGTPASVWQSDPRLLALPPLDLAEVRTLIVVAAHPDDETLGAGGLIATAGERGIPTTVIVATDGGASHLHRSDAAHQAHIDRRSAELHKATARLNPEARVVELALPDGATREHRARLESLLAPHLDSSGPQALIAVPWRGDGHRDHRIVGEVAERVAAASGIRVIEYPIWLWHWAQPGSGDMPWGNAAGLPLTEGVHHRKREAILEFESQTGSSTDPPAAAMLRADFLEHFEGAVEIFIENPRASLDSTYFDQLYERRDDPWRLATRWYEKRKRAITMAALPHERYGSGLEIGCSIGMLTEGLAKRCDHLLAVDLAAGALASARERLSESGQVSFAQVDASVDFPDGRFDLIVISEIGYYLTRPDLRRLLDTASSRLESEGTLVLCHWRHPVSDYPLLGDEVHDMMRTTTTLSLLASHVEDDFILEVYSPRAESVAEREGLA